MAAAATCTTATTGCCSIPAALPRSRRRLPQASPFCLAAAQPSHAAPSTARHHHHLRQAQPAAPAGVPSHPQAWGGAPRAQRGGPAAASSSSVAHSAQGSGDGFTYTQLDLPPPVNSRVTKCVFSKSSAKVADCPPASMPEFAVIGRSNVGKSSLINCLTGNDKLAKVSKTPGMTKLINHFLVNDAWYLVDLPGYGFSKTASKVERAEWLEFTKDYFISRDNIAHVLLLVDGSLPPQQVDVECVNWLAECEVPFAIVFTKTDQRKKDGPAPAQNVRAFKRLLAEDWAALPWCFETSSKTGAGKAELLGYMASVRQMYVASGGH